MTDATHAERRLGEEDPCPSYEMRTEDVDEMVDRVLQEDPSRLRSTRPADRRPLVLAGVAVLVVVSLVVGVLVAARPAGRSTPTLMSWETVGSLDAAWHVSPSQALRHGGGYLACPTSSTCVAEVPPFALVGHPSRLRLEVTHDAGLRWAPVTLPAGITQAANRFVSFDAVSCRDVSACVVLAQRSGALVLLRSGDGGTSWRTLPGPVVPPHFAIESLSCASAETCVIVGGLEPRDAEPSPTFAEVTSDAGARWEERPLPKGFGPHVVQCFADGACVAVGIHTRKYQVDAAYSSDGGASWHQAAIPAVPSQVVASQLSCGGPDRCLLEAATSDAHLVQLASVDRGATWGVRVERGLPRVPLDRVLIGCGAGGQCWGQLFPLPTYHLAPSRDAPAARAGGSSQLPATDLYASSDLGAVWQPRDLPPDVQNLIDVDCPSASRCFALAIADGGGEVFLAARS